MPACFLTTNDITGGNSGSPVINGNGELIGAAFDGNWKSLSGDINFDNNLQRFEIMNIESWNRVTFSLSFREHRFGRNDVHSSSETFRLFSSKEDIVFRNAFL